MLASRLSSLKRALSSIDSLKPFNTYKKKKNPALPDSILQITVYLSLDITKKYSYCKKCNSLLSSLFLCEELLLLMPFCCFIFNTPQIVSEELEVLYEQRILVNLAEALQVAGLCSVTSCCHWQNELVSHKTPS